MAKKIFITGGHFTPAKAVLSELVQDPQWEIFYLGRKHALEGDKAISLEFQELKNNSQITFLEINPGRPTRTLTKRTVPALLKIPWGFVQSLYYLIRFRPDIILSFGGYVAIPVAVLGWILSIPIVHHEQVPALDFPGKLLTSLATRVLVSFSHLLPKVQNPKWQYVGNPLRREIYQVSYTPELQQIKKKKTELKLPVLYITGGNQGSHAINKIVGDCLTEILKLSLVIWQTGDSRQFADFENILRLTSQLPKHLTGRILVKKFFLEREIGAVFSLTDFALTRSGANITFELAALGIPAIFVPLPWTHHQEQLRNAETLKSFGSTILPQVELNPQKLKETIIDLMKNLPYHQKLAQKAKSTIPLDASEKIIANLKEVVSKKP